MRADRIYKLFSFWSYQEGLWGEKLIRKKEINYIYAFKSRQLNLNQ